MGSSKHSRYTVRLNEVLVEHIIERIKRGHYWKFHGGIHPPEQKFLTNSKPIRSLAMPSQLILPLQQHIGRAGKLLVAVGDKVLKGQALTFGQHPMSVPIHAPTSGSITAIKPSVIAHPSGMQELCIFLAPDGEEQWKKRELCANFQSLSNSAIIEKIANAGISGMGGAGFPTHIKVNAHQPIKYLIINAAECEPYITADDLLMREQSATIIDGIEILNKLIEPEFIFIGIEDNKPDAITALKKATKHLEKVTVCVLPTIYPAGGEKQLIQMLTGQEVPSGVLPNALGIVMQNVATCYAIADAVINDVPLIKRVVTVSGQALNKPQNIWALLGTPVEHLLAQCGHQTQHSKQLIMGGPMMGYTLPSPQVPVVKTTNCILVPSNEEIPTTSKEVECIRCGQCADVCPSQLLPQELQWSAKAKDQTQLKALNLFDCIECGACAYVCPSQIPLVHYYRIAKAEIREQQVIDLKAEQAKKRFEARKIRLEKEKRAREEKHKKAAEARKARMNSGTPSANKEKSAVAAALARVKAKKLQSSTETVTEPEQDVASEKSQVSAAIARAKAKKLAAQQAKNKKEHLEISAADKNTKSVNNSKKPSTTTEPKTNSDQQSPTANKTRDKATKIAATIAKAKAKKLAQKNAQVSSKTSEPVAHIENGTTLPREIPLGNDSTTEQPKTLSAAQLKKAKIAAAVAKAKAKNNSDTRLNKTKPAESKLALTSAEQNTSIDAVKKKRIAAAVAKAKAKKQQQESK